LPLSDRAQRRGRLPRDGLRCAHFTCFETDDDDDSGDGNVIGAILGGMIEGAMETDACVLEHAERPRPPPPARAESFVRRDLEPKNGPVLRARLPISGGLLTALGAPQREPRHVWLMLQRHSGPRLPDDCPVSLYRDGEPIAYERVPAPPSTDFAIAISPTSLRDLHLAQRVVGDLCGVRFQLDERDRKALSLFEMQVREELDRLKVPAAAATEPLRSTM
jgi:hypothetical protein